MRQLLYVRPGTVVVVDDLTAAQGKNVPEVQWLLQVPTDAPEVGKGSVVMSNAKSWLRCRRLTAPGTLPGVGKSQMTQLSRDHRKLSPVSRVTFTYKEQPGKLTLVHLIEVGDGAPGALLAAKHTVTADAVEVTLAGKTYTFSRHMPFKVSAK